MKKVLLGSTGLSVSKIGFGSLTMSPSQLALPCSEGAEVIRYALERGINLIDTAQYYNSYEYIREALRRWQGDEPVIVSKSLTNDYREMLEAVEEARCQLGRDVIDIFLLHEVVGLSDLEDRKPALEALLEAKTRGWINHCGLSTHHTDVAEAAAAMKEIEVLFPLINVAGLGIRRGHDFGTKEEMAAAIEIARKNGIGTLAMKAFGGGPLLGRYQEALQYVLNLPGVDSVMVGFGSTEEVDRIFEAVDGTLSPDYVPDLTKKKLFIDQGDCVGCGSCIKRCPNGALSFSRETGLAQVDESLCMTCGYCTPVCPVRAIIFLTKK